MSARESIPDYLVQDGAVVVPPALPAVVVLEPDAVGVHPVPSVVQELAQVDQRVVLGCGQRTTHDHVVTERLERPEQWTYGDNLIGLSFNKEWVVVAA